MFLFFIYGMKLTTNGCCFLHLKMDAWNTIVSPLGRLGLFSGAIRPSFREGILFSSIAMSKNSPPFFLATASNTDQTLINSQPLGRKVENFTKPATGWWKIRTAGRDYDHLDSTMINAFHRALEHDQKLLYRMYFCNIYIIYIYIHTCIYIYAV